MEQSFFSKKAKIAKVEVTSDKISGRGGLFFILRYIENLRFYQFCINHFGSLKSSSKGLSVAQFVKQLLAFFMDGSDMSMTSFDRRKNDEAYAAILENTPEEMASSHQMKRFFHKFLVVGNSLFRAILLYLFIWRLRIERPEFIVLHGDSVVFDNDDAEKREGVAPTYKRKKGFQPLQIKWGAYVVDSLFRRGDVHCNHGSDLIKAVTRLVRAIREKYRDLPIILVTDSGYMDEQNFIYFDERLGIHFICVGKLYDDIKGYVQQLSMENFSLHHQSWHYVEFANRLKSWTKFRRCIYTTQDTDENGQLQFAFVRPDSLLYTNIGQNPKLDEKLAQAAGEKYLQAETIIELDHQRGKSELVHRSEKEFAQTEQLPFERWGMNQAYYYFMLISHFLYEAYKRDVSYDVLPVASYPTTFRRHLIDFAAKVVSKGGQMILKVTQAVLDHLQLQDLWRRSGAVQPILIT